MTFLTAFFRKLVKLVLFVSALALAIWIGIFDSTPTVNNYGSPSSDEIAELPKIVKRTKDAMNSKSASVNLSARDINILDKVASNRFPELNVSTSLHTAEAAIQYSIEIREGLFINGSTRIHQDKPIELTQTRVGALPLPSSLANYALKKIIVHRSSEETYALAKDQLGAVKITPEGVSTEISIADNSEQKLLAAIREQSHRELESKHLQPELIEQYMQYFRDIANTKESRSKNHSISIYIKALISPDKPLLLGEAPASTGILALALLNDSNLLHHLLPVDKALATNDIPMTLHGRRDLSKHFLISAAVKILIDKGISNSIGEAKEILDSASGGSGFSFVDLTADRSGVAFAGLVSGIDGGTVSRARVAKSLSEEDLMPKISKLEEGLTEAQFSEKYGDTQSERYKVAVQKIDADIEKSKLYQ